MAIKKDPIGKQKPQPGFSPKPVRRVKPMGSEGSDPSPSPSFTPWPLTPTPSALGRKK
jgi:hypothetical protein